VTDFLNVYKAVNEASPFLEKKAVTHYVFKEQNLIEKKMSNHFYVGKLPLISDTMTGE
jgi:hypothetical protein